MDSLGVYDSLPNLGICARLTVGEAAKLLKVSRATVCGLAERGELPAVRVSNAIRVRTEDLEDLRRER